MGGIKKRAAAVKYGTQSEPSRPHSADALFGNTKRDRSFPPPSVRRQSKNTNYPNVGRPALKPTPEWLVIGLNTKHKLSKPSTMTSKKTAWNEHLSEMVFSKKTWLWAGLLIMLTNTLRSFYFFFVIFLNLLVWSNLSTFLLFLSG